MRVCVFLLLSLAVAATPALAAEIPVFVVAGQSNAVGYKTNVTTLSDSLKAAQPNVLYSGDCPLHMVKWAPLVPPTQIGQTWYGQPERGGRGGFGPEISIGKTISDARGGQLVAITKFAHIHTSLYEAWNPRTPRLLYSQMLIQVRGVVEKLHAQRPADTGKVAGFFWMQGERDAGENRTTAQYEADLTELIVHLRADFGDPNLPFVFGRITTLWGDHHSIRDAQANVAKNVHHTFMMDLDRLETFQATAIDPADPGHFSNQGTVDMGIGFANGYLTLKR